MSTGASFKCLKTIRRLHVGPLGVHIDGYGALLQEQGNARQSARVHLQVLADFSRHLCDIDPTILEHYLRRRRRFVGRHPGASRALNVFLRMLPELGIV